MEGPTEGADANAHEITAGQTNDHKESQVAQIEPDGDAARYPDGKNAVDAHVKRMLNLSYDSKR